MVSTEILRKCNTWMMKESFVVLSAISCAFREGGKISSAGR